MFDPIAHVARRDGGYKMSTTIKFMMAAAALVGATVLFSGATEERLDIRSPAGCPAFAWPNSYSACLDDGIRPSGALQEVEFAAADRLTTEPMAFE
jgi:hypothetical protein